jgi:hypothetical protein
MADYTTKAWTVKDVTVTVSKKTGGTAGDRLVAWLEWLHTQFPDPGYGKPEGPQGRPDQGLPGEGRPPHASGQPVPPGGAGKPDQGLPGKPPGTATQPKPDNTLPGGSGGSAEQPGIDNSLPEVIGSNAKEIAKEILGHCMNCDTAQPKK